MKEKIYFYRCESRINRELFISMDQVLRLMDNKNPNFEHELVYKADLFIENIEEALGNKINKKSILVSILPNNKNELIKAALIFEDEGGLADFVCSPYELSWLSNENRFLILTINISAE